ncbi:hypothetical protein SCHPADRAFT_1002411 [Schizopora paradoxa]|uniref:DUF6533 domain-containing protein n=1 Tax=Schizopora paradoxa TaxID=27342 RepID=A0A0H2RA01_9AGAM|nr:hypothetical protein SCHPADRAFT_1002411 [Schizopora paradoxa]
MPSKYIDTDLTKWLKKRTSIHSPSSMDPESLDNIFKTVQIFQYTTIASVGLVAYEYLIKLDVEIHYLWGRRITFGGVLLGFCRYLPFINIYQIIVFVSMKDTDPAQCLIGDRSVSSLVFVEFILSLLVLFTRAYAVWGRSKYVLILITIILTSSVAGTTYAVFLFLSNTKARPSKLTSSCLFTLGNNDVWIGLVILIFCESSALGLLLIKSVEHARETRDLVSVGSRTQSILAVMAQDGIGYFACTLVITSAKLVVLGRVTPDLRDFLFITQGALQNILCSRLLFHIRSVHEGREESLADNSTMNFDVFLSNGTRD